LRERIDPLSGDVAHRVDRNADRNRLDIEQCRLDVGAEIGLGQDDDRGGAALPAQGEVALEAPGIEVAVEARGQEDDVDVRGDDLLDRVAAVRGRHPRELRPAWQDRLDERPLGAVGIGDRDPVADGRQLAAPAHAVAKPTGELGPAFPARGVEQVGTPLLDGDARGLEAVGGERGELVFDGWNPAEVRKQREISFVASKRVGARACSGFDSISDSRNGRQETRYSASYSIRARACSGLDSVFSAPCAGGDRQARTSSSVPPPGVAGRRKPELYPTATTSGAKSRGLSLETEASRTVHRRRCPGDSPTDRSG